MAGKFKHNYPSNEEIQKLLDQHGSVYQVARLLGIPGSTFQHHCSRQGLLPSPGEPIKVQSEVSQEEILEQRVKELETHHRAQRKQDVFEERVIKAISDALEAREPKYSPRVIPKSKRDTEKHEFVLLWSDCHAGEIVKAEETNGINEYDWQIMLDRHDRLREGLFSFLDNRPYEVEKLHVWALGDMLSGNIHEELSETNEMPLAECVVQGGLDFAVWMESLLERFNQIEVAGVVGNHPRAHKKPRAKQSFDNGDWLMYHTMELALRKYKNINFNIPKASTVPITVAENWRALILHGDSIRSTMPGVPWGGVMRRVTALQNQYTSARLPIDIFCLGHFHTANLVEGSGGRVAMNGSIKGVDEYSLKAFGSGRNAQQMLLTFHPRRGLTDVSIIDLQDVKPLDPSKDK